MDEQNSIASAKKWIIQAIHDIDMAQAVISVEALIPLPFCLINQWRNY